MIAGKNKKGKVFFDLFIENERLSYTYIPYGNSMSIDLSELEDVSVENIMKYISENPEKFFMHEKSNIKIKNCVIEAYRHDSAPWLKQDMITLFYMHETSMYQKYFIIRNISVMQ